MLKAFSQASFCSLSAWTLDYSQSAAKTFKFSSKVANNVLKSTRKKNPHWIKLHPAFYLIHQAKQPQPPFLTELMETVFGWCHAAGQKVWTRLFFFPEIRHLNLISFILGAMGKKSVEERFVLQPLEPRAPACSSKQHIIAALAYFHFTDWICFICSCPSFC